LWEVDRTLARAWLQKNDDNGHPVWPLLSEREDVVEIVVERPQVYSARFLRGDPNDLVTIAIVGAELVGMFRTLEQDLKITWYYPKTWKGNVDKAAHQPRILSTLSDVERACITTVRAKALMHNVIDAVGIGLFHLGRMDRGKTRKVKTA
jgi:hypothetical protein